MFALFAAFLCDECGKRFEFRDHLRFHMKSHAERAFKCAQCPYAGKTKQAVAKHSKNVHVEGQMFSCHFCGKLLKSTTTLRKHLSKCVPRKLGDVVNVGGLVNAEYFRFNSYAYAHRRRSQVPMRSMLAQVFHHD